MHRIRFEFVPQAAHQELQEGDLHGPMPSDWPTLIDNLHARLDNEARVSMTIDEIVAVTHCRDEALRERWYWRATQLGAKNFERFTDAGLHLQFFPDERSRDVETVTFYR